MDELRPDVVAGKYDPVMFDKTGQTLLINEVFYSFQGEGDNAGKAALFIRLSKCNLACKFCDTEFEAYESLPLDGGKGKNLMSVIDEALQVTPGIVAFNVPSAPPLVILTGGEPALQNCEPLIHKLRNRGHRVAIETSGSVWSPWMRYLDHICVSPKVAVRRMPLPLMNELFRRSESNRDITLKGGRAEVKWIVNDAWTTMFKHNPMNCYVSLPGVQNYLQPESQNEKHTKTAIDFVRAFPDRYQLSMQMHKFAGVR